MSHVLIEPVGPKNKIQMLEYLNVNEDTSQFLINNFKDHGPNLTAHPNSGNFKLLLKGNEVQGVFCLTKRGNLLAQTSGNYASEVLSDIESESIELNGFVGDWTSIEPIWESHKSEKSNVEASFYSKEILYSYPLSGDDPKLAQDKRVRLLVASDYEQWEPMSVAYLKELGLSDQLSDEEKRNSFDAGTAKKEWWGLFENGELVSRAALNSNGDDIGQVGGVFTPKELRKKGLAKATMFHMLYDCLHTHGHRKSILFTGETDIPAQKLYESMGYKKVGSFALIFIK